jgi:hypothetical protein
MIMTPRKSNCRYASIIILISALKIHQLSAFSLKCYHNNRVGRYYYHSRSHASSRFSEVAIAEDDNNTATKHTEYRGDTNLAMDRRPSEQRVKGPRKARRLNHSFMHLYR